jgi:hypothetical protein
MFPPGRYGRRRAPGRKRSRWVVPVIAVAVAAIMGLLSVKLYHDYGTPEFTPNVVKLTNATNNSVDVTFTVAKPSGDAAICTVDALTSAGSALGTADISVPAGKNVQVTATIKTSGHRQYSSEQDQATHWYLGRLPP